VTETGATEQRHCTIYYDWINVHVHNIAQSTWCLTGVWGNNTDYVVESPRLLLHY